MTNYPKAKDGEWIAPRRWYKMACCDCGLIHRMEFSNGVNSKTGRKQIVFRAWRDNRATAAMRRGKSLKKIRRVLGTIEDQR